ncbi:MAG TPA: polyphosphate kinase 1, partial [Acidobacteriota bacterium]|nr:polyphosphate kinase 1 [Acidobacteriota bacterium]
MKESATPDLFFNRELSWLEFNQRVIDEAMDTTTPLLERCRFVSIACSNLDEFFMVRVAAQKNASTNERDPAGFAPAETLKAISIRAHEMVDQIYQEVHERLLPALAQIGIVIRSYDSLSERQRAYLKEKFDNEIFPVLTPMALDPTHPFPVLLNLSLNVGVALKPPEDEEEPRLALVPIPAVLSRLWRIPAEKQEFVLLEEIVRQNIQDLFAGKTLLGTVIFRVTRDAELEFDDEGSASLIKTMESELRKRRTNPVVRFEVEESIPKDLLEIFKKLGRVQDPDLYLNPMFVDLRFLSLVADLPGFADLHYPVFPPQLSPEVQDPAEIWSLLREKDLILHHPFDSFEPVIQILSQAADDPGVLAIKQTLYRTSGDSPVIRALERAALAGKQVTVLVELMARFDEERNIEWARRLEKAGAHVIYGLAHLKTHAKILLIVRKEPQGIRRYIHLSTGNYNDRTARLYTDVGMLTADEAIGSDASSFFNTITGYSDPPAFNKLVMAPLNLRDRIVQLINREADRARSGQRASIHAKMNSLVDPPIIKALYDASQAGVQIKLAVRGICCLRPDLKGTSERIQVISIVDRFLEHSRIFYYQNGGDEEYYCSSADWMPRN